MELSNKRRCVRTEPTVYVEKEYDGPLSVRKRVLLLCGVEGYEVYIWARDVCPIDQVVMTKYNTFLVLRMYPLERLRRMGSGRLQEAIKYYHLAHEQWDIIC